MARSWDCQAYVHGHFSAIRMVFGAPWKYDNSYNHFLIFHKISQSMWFVLYEPNLWKAGKLQMLTICSRVTLTERVKNDISYVHYLLSVG